MSFFGVRYWRVLFWLNVIIAVIHALHGRNEMFLALGMAVVCKVMVKIHEANDQSTEN